MRKRNAARYTLPSLSYPCLDEQTRRAVAELKVRFRHRRLRNSGAGPIKRSENSPMTILAFARLQRS